MKLLLSVFTFVSFDLILCENQCSSKEDCDSNLNNLYSSFDNEIFKLIELARVSYKPCQFSNCSCFFNVLNNDLKQFKDGVSKTLFEQAVGKGVKYQIIDGRLYRDRECMFPARCSGVEYFLNLLRKEVPNLEIVINVKDWPQISKHFTTALPVFSFSKTKDYHDILYPAWSFWDGGPAIKLYPTGIGRWDKFREILTKEVKSFPWKKKKNKAFFRGSRTSDERDPLILLSRKKPSLVNAAYTKNQAWKSDQDTLGKPPAEEVSLERHCHYKYLFNFRGVAASFRFKFLFLCKSLVFHVGDEWIEFFYPSLLPWIHYVPVKSPTKEEELEKLINFFKRNPDVAEKIANEGFELVWNSLDMNNIKCYWKNLLLEYHKLIKYKIVLDQNLIDVTKS